LPAAPTAAISSLKSGCAFTESAVSSRTLFVGCAGFGRALSSPNARSTSCTK
jgi:hypothetical protein